MGNLGIPAPLDARTVSAFAEVYTRRDGQLDRRYGPKERREASPLSPERRPCASGCGRPRGIATRGTCKTCHAAYMREHRPKYAEMTDLQRQKANARSYARSYVKRGLLKIRPCKFRPCGRKPQMHHADYARPLAVEFVCRFHHMKYRHGENGHE